MSPVPTRRDTMTVNVPKKEQNTLSRRQELAAETETGHSRGERTDLTSIFLGLIMCRLVIRGLPRACHECLYAQCCAGEVTTEATGSSGLPGMASSSSLS